MTKTSLLDALKCKNVNSRPPVWLMRQAGRYLPEYRALRQKHSFLEMCHTPEIATEVTLQPIRRFGMDAAILFSDILVIPEALDVGLRFEDSKGPIIERPLNTAVDVDNLRKPDISEKLDFVSKAIISLRKELKVPLIGFAGAPFTVASYMIEGGSSKSLKKTKMWMFNDPTSFHKLLNLIADCTIDYLNMQIDAGVQAVQLFDSWANVLSSQQFQEVSLPYMKKILGGIKNKNIPTILFCKGSSVFAPLMVEAAPSAISLDWNVDLSILRKRIGPNIALQGNLDPDILYAPHEKIRTEVKNILKSMHNDPGYVFNLGHGILPDMDFEAVKTLVDTIKEY